MGMSRKSAALEVNDADRPRLRVGIVDDADCVLDVHEVSHGRVPAKKKNKFF